MVCVCCIPLLLLSLPFTWGSLESSTSLPAYVAITVEETDGTPAESRLLSPFVTQGTFSTAGTFESAEGNLCLVDKDFFLNFDKNKADEQWIGLIYHSEEEDSTGEERDNRGNKKSDGEHHHHPEKKKSLAERMKKLILLGASALIIVVKNVRFTKEFDARQVLTKPVVLFHGVENVTKILQLISLRYNIFAKIQKSFPYYSAVGTIGTVTLWATCGRSTSGAYHEWQGVVCIGNDRFSGKTFDDYFTAMAWNVCFILFLCFLVYIYVTLSRSSLDGMANLEDEVGNEGLAQHVLSQMRIVIYRSRGRTSAKKSKKTFLQKENSMRKFENALDHCAICLDSFFPLQRLRVLPCNHSFHLTCIDRWLVAQHTCPMCKFDILNHHRLKEAARNF